jgi:small-conductance mechanosensitive channel/CRP-like cAMP-binding protein
MTSVAQRIALPGAIFLAFLSIFFFGDNAFREFGSQALGRTYEYLPVVLAVGAWMSAAFLCNRIANMVLWETILPRVTGAPTPRLLLQISGGMIFFVAIVGIVGIVFDQSVTGLLAASGAIGLVVGLALRSIILDLFCGIAMNVERPFQMGEYINVQSRGISNCSGRVEEVNWRSTRLLTSEGSMQIIPNSIIGSAVITNFSRPTPSSEFEQVVVLDFSIDSNRVLRILDAALKEAVLVGGVLPEPSPKARISAINETGVHYKVKYHIDPRKGGPGKMRHLVLDHVLHHLKKAGLTPAYPKQDTFTADMPTRELDYYAHGAELLSRMDLFRPLTDAERKRLSDDMVLRQFESGEEIIRHGQPGNSMFILVEGVLDVRAPVEGQDIPASIGRIRPGEFFGEMSLLTGAPRSATVVAAAPAVAFEIGKKPMAQLLESRPLVANAISKAVAERQLANSTRRMVEPEVVEKEVSNLAGRILNGILSFFGLSSKAA